jgi:DNA-binding transcriptional regulator GbsR (MarR family)
VYLTLQRETMNESITINRTLEKARKLLYRPIYNYSEFNIFVYANETRKLNEKQELIKELQIQLEEDRRELKKRHQRHMNRLIEKKTQNPLQ